MNTKIIFSFIFLLSLNIIVAQNADFKSIHQQESEYYNQFNFQNDSDWNVIRGAFKPNGRVNSKACNLNKIVFGWHPYWSNGLEANYDWSLISDLSYFSYDVDPATGNATSGSLSVTPSSLPTTYTVSCVNLSLGQQALASDTVSATASKKKPIFQED